MSHLIRRAVTTLALAVSAVGLLGAEVAHAGEMYKVNTAGPALTVRSGPGTTYSTVGSVPDAGSVEINCQTTGTYVTGTYGRSNIWDQIAPGKFVSDSYVLTGHDGQFRPTCTTTGPGAVTNDYPYRGQTTGVDPWNFYKGQCTSFVAWRINNRLHLPFHNRYLGSHFSNAKTWDEAARAEGIRVDHTPTVGAVAQWNTGDFGHVAWVARVNTNGTVLIEEYNYRRDQYTTRTLSSSAVTNYIHF